MFERNRAFVYIEKVLDIWVQLMKNGGKNKIFVCIILVNVYIWEMAEHVYYYTLLYVCVHVRLRVCVCVRVCVCIYLFIYLF